MPKHRGVVCVRLRVEPMVRPAAGEPGEHQMVERVLWMMAVKHGEQCWTVGPVMQAD